MAQTSRLLKFFASIVCIGVTFVPFTPRAVRAAELVMFGSAGCAWCQTFDREIGAVYDKTEEGKRAPLRRLDIGGPLPADLAGIRVERLTPLFILVDKGREIGRIRGYPGEDHFWGLLGALIKQLDTPGTDADGLRAREIQLRAAG